MSQWIDGVHHIALKPTAEQYEKTVEFYTQLLGFEVKKSWGDPQRPCLMVSCGDNSCLEIIPEKEMSQKGGASTTWPWPPTRWTRPSPGCGRPATRLPSSPRHGAGRQPHPHRLLLAHERVHRAVLGEVRWGSAASEHQRHGRAGPHPAGGAASAALRGVLHLPGRGPQAYLPAAG